MNFSKKNQEHRKINSNFVSNKLGFIVIAVLGFMYSASAQEVSSNAIGLRFGDNDGFGVEVSYQRKINTKNRLELDLGLRDNRDYDAWKLTGVYQWLWNIDGGFNWYAGFGAGVGDWDNNSNRNRDDGFFLNAVGNVGIEYNFKIPLLLSFDFRPEIGLINDVTDDDLDYDFALSVRYQF